MHQTFVMHQPKIGHESKEKLWKIVKNKNKNVHVSFWQIWNYTNCMCKID